jgi:uncharacterized protein
MMQIPPLAGASRRTWLRQALGALVGAGAAPAWAAVAAAGSAERPLRLALGWDEIPAEPGAERTRCLGVWGVAGDHVEVVSRMVVPTRAHGLSRLPSGELLAVARRPGLWMRRWSPDGTLRREAWAEPGRQFNGHALPSPDGRLLFCTEQSNEDGAGCVALRDATTLALLGEWPTGGTDPHQLLRVGDTLYVANGGVPTRPETGRAKQAMSAMDSSLVAFDWRSGRRTGQWRLPDARLSLRHLAWHAGSSTLGIALQAEHDDASDKSRAPLLAVFDGHTLRPMASPAEHAAEGAGYAGDIAATPDGFVLSATRAGALIGWSPTSGWTAATPLVEACALVTGGAAPGPLALGADRAMRWGADGAQRLPVGCKPDNHAMLLDA